MAGEDGGARDEPIGRSYDPCPSWRERVTKISKNRGHRGSLDTTTHASVIDVRLLTTLLRQCIKSKALEEGQKIHAQLKSAGQLLHLHTLLSNLLVQMYGSCGHPDQARAVFDAIHSKNSYSWNIMLAAYLHCRDLSSAQSLLREMPFVDILASNTMLAGFIKNRKLEAGKDFFDSASIRDVISWNSIVAAYAQTGHMFISMEVFDRMPCTNVASWNSILSGYIKNGKIDTAYEIFSTMLERDVYSWTTMIVATSQLGRSIEAFALFQRMDLDGVSPDEFTFSSVIDACGDLPFATAGKLVHEEFRLSGLGSEPNVENALVSMYSNLGRVDLAWKIFQSMPRRDVVSWTAIAAACAQYGQLEFAQIVFERLPQHDVVSYTSLISAFASTGFIHEGKALFDSAPARNLVTWNTMLTGYANSGYYNLSLWLFKSMDLEGLKPDRVSFIVAIESCAGIASLAEGKLLHSLLLEREETLELSVETATCLIHLYGRCGCLETAREIFDSVAGGRDRVPWNVMLSIYAESGNYSMAMDLFRAMAIQGVEVDEVASVAAITACSRSGGVDDGRHCFACLVGDFALRPVIDHYICVMDALGRVGMLDDAQELLETMPFERDETAWLAFVSACKLHGDVERCVSVACQAVVTGSATPATFVLLSNSFSSDDNSTNNQAF